MKATAKRPIHGWLNIDKPLHMSSAQVVGAVKRLTRAQKVGHAGTLDPLASGILPIALGEATKTSGYMMDATKDYRFTVTFGESRSTDDAEGEVIERSDHRPSEADLLAVLPSFTGTIEQVPPIYSAIKQDGKRAYALARAGEVVTMQPRLVQIHCIALLDYDGTHATLDVTCGKGTYIRSLARDIAIVLGTVGYVSMLRRRRVGNFSESNAISLDFLEKLVHSPADIQGDSLDRALLPIFTALDDIPAHAVDSKEATMLRRGQVIACRTPFTGGIIAVMEQGELVALCERQGQLLKPKRVFNH